MKKRTVSLLFALALAACNPYLPATPTPTPIATATATQALTPTPAPLPTGDPVTAVTLIVRQPTVYLRAEPAGAPIAALRAGAPVELIGDCVRGWCEVIAELDGQRTMGFVWQGCLSVVAQGRRCEAR